MSFKPAAVGLFALCLIAGVAQAQVPQAATCTGDIPAAATVERASFKVRGRDIEALLFRPTGQPNGAGVVILHGAGGLHADVPRLEAGLSQLASRGYLVLMPSYYDVSPGRSQTAARDAPLARDHWEQVGDEAIRHLAGLPEVDDGRVASWGFSLGAALALNGAIDDGPARAVVAVAGAGELRRGRNPAPVLLIAADQDPVVTIDRVNTTADALRRRGVPVSMQTLHTTKHLFDPPIWCEVFDHTRRFLDAQLLASQS